VYKPHPEIWGQYYTGKILLSSACARILPTWAYFIASWSPDGWMSNNYVTSITFA